MPSIPRSQLVPYGIAALLVLAIAGRWLGSRGTHDDAGTGPRGGAGGTAAVRLDRADDHVTVHVAGAVRRPGVYTLAAGKRVEDAVRRADGVTSRADADSVNLAARLVDGQQIIVPAKARAAGGGGAPVATDGPLKAPVSLNSATADQLDELDGVGPAIAQKIIDFRTQHGGLASVDDLDQIPGIGPKKIEALRGQVAP